MFEDMIEKTFAEQEGYIYTRITPKYGGPRLFRYRKYKKYKTDPEGRFLREEFMQLRWKSIVTHIPSAGIEEFISKEEWEEYKATVERWTALEEIS